MGKKRKKKRGFTGYTKYIPFSRLEFLMGAGVGVFGYCSNCGRRYDSHPLAIGRCGFC